MICYKSYSTFSYCSQMEHIKYLIVGTDMSIMSIINSAVLLLIVGSKNSLEKANIRGDIFEVRITRFTSEFLTRC